MPTTEPIDVVRAFMDAMAVKDYDAALKHVDADVEYDNVPFAVVRGPAGIRAVLEPAFAPILENEFVVRHEATNGDAVILERLDRHRFPWGWRELPVTGVIEVKNGKITLWRDYFDRGQFETAFTPA